MVPTSTSNFIAEKLAENRNIPFKRFSAIFADPSHIRIKNGDHSEFLYNNRSFLVILEKNERFLYLIR